MEVHSPVMPMYRPTLGGRAMRSTRYPMLLLIALSIPALARAAAGVPEPGNSTIPAHINLVGRAGTNPDIAGTFTVKVRDSFNVPVNSPLVEVDFSGCGGVAPGVQYQPGLSVDCGTQRVQGIAGTNGEIDMVITGFGKQGPNTPACARIWANGIDLGTVRVSAFDLNGMNGVDMGDLALFEADLFGNPFPTNPERSDFDGSSVVDLADLSKWACEYFTLRATQSAANCAGTLIVSPVVTSGTMNIAWDDCFPGTSTNSKVFACNTNSGSAFRAVVSVIPNVSIPSAHSFSADIDLQSLNASATSLPSWWQLAQEYSAAPSGCGGGIDGCRELGLTLTLNGDLTACSSPSAATTGTSLRQLFYNVGGPGRATLRLQGVFGSGAGSSGGVSLNAGEEYHLVTLNIGKQKTTGTGACAGCTTPMCLTLRSVDIRQDVTVNPTLATYHIIAPAQQTTIGWQATSPEVALCEVTPAKNRTWGQLKQLYR